MVSADEQGFVEYWQPSEPWGLPSVPGLWDFKSSTDLFHFKKVNFPLLGRLPSFSKTCVVASLFQALTETLDQINTYIIHFLPVSDPVCDILPPISKYTHIQLPHW